ncbi:MAG: hypothetical protein WC428_02285 [Candidatus Paceibacterota bacterium]
MNIPRIEIQQADSFARNLQRIKFIHYRDCYTHIDTTNFQISTKADFKEVKIDEGKNAHWQFNLIAEQPNIIYNFKSKTGSQYLIDKENNLYRLSNHWGAVASCVWTLDGRGELCMSLMVCGEWELGVANLKDFIIYRRRQEKRRDFILNPLWIQQIKLLIPIQEKLQEIKFNPEFKELSSDDKNLIGTSWGKITGELKSVPA